MKEVVIVPVRSGEDENLDNANRFLYNEI